MISKNPVAMPSTDSVTRTAGGPRSAAVLDLPRGASPTQTLDLLSRDDRLALVALVLERPMTAPDGRTRLLRQLDRLIGQCRHLGFDPAVSDRLDRSIREADPEITQSLTKLLRQLLGGSPVLVIRRRGPDTAPLKLPDEFTNAIGELFGITIELLESIDEVFSAPFERQPPRGLFLNTDRELFEVLTCPDVQLAQRWSEWLVTASVDDQRGIQSVAPLLQERLHRLGVVNTETGRLTGLRRQAWFSNTLMKADSAEIHRRLGEVDINPVFRGNIISALEAEQDGRVRKIGTASIIVGIEEAQRALDHLTRVHEPTSPQIQLGPITQSQQSKILLRMATDRSLAVQWRWLPERGANLVPLTAGEIDTVELEGTAVRALSPAARLVDLCVTSAALRPGNTLAVYMQATELIDRHHARIDWEWVQSAFERLDLVPHAGVMLAQLPERVRAPVPILQ